MRCITGHVHKDAHEEGAWSCCWVPGGARSFVSGAVDETVKLWSIGDDGITIQKTYTAQAGHSLGVISVSVDSTGEWLASSALDSYVRVVSLKEQSQERATLESSPTEVWSVQFSPQKDKCVVAGAGGSTGAVKLWDLTDVQPGVKSQQPTPESIAVMEASKDASKPMEFVLSVAYSPDGRSIACGGMDGSVAVVDVETKQVKSRLAGNFRPVRSVAFMPDGKQVLTASDNMQVHLYEASGNLIEAFSGHESWVLDVAPHPNGQHFLSASSDGSVKLWDIPQRACAMTSREHTDQVWGVALSPDGSEAVSCGDDGKVVSYTMQ